MIKATDLPTAQPAIEAKVKSILAGKFGVDEKEITPEKNFKNDFGADSLDVVELIVEFEKEFNIAIADADAEKIRTVGQAVQHIHENKKESVLSKVQF